MFLAVALAGSNDSPAGRAGTASENSEIDVNAQRWSTTPTAPDRQVMDAQRQDGVATRHRCRLKQRYALIGAGLIALVWGAPVAALDPVPLHSDAAQRVADILVQIRSRYVEPIDDRKLVSDAVNGVLRGLDPHSKYLDAEAFKRMQDESRGRYGGVGIELRTGSGGPSVAAVIDGSPAQRAGVLPGDRISRIDELDTASVSLEQVVQRMRGEPDSQVRLTLVRDGEREPLVLTLTRAVIQWQSVRARLVVPGVAYVRLSQFQEQTPPMLASALERLWKDSNGGWSGIVLDLRDNPGGLISAAVGVSAAFLPKDVPVVSADGAGQGSSLRRAARRADYLRGPGEDYLAHLPAEIKKLPLIVLVNGNSASASEIVAGALQDHRRGTILGTQTRGKGSIQQLIPFDDGSGLKITTSYYYTPNGHKVHGKGITPDVLVDAQASSVRLTDATPAQPALDAGPAAVDATASAPCMRGVRTASVEPGESEEVDCQLEEALSRLGPRAAGKPTEENN